MKRLLTIAFAALFSLCALVQAEGPDDRYIEIYKLIQEGDQFAATAQPSFAQTRYSTALTNLKALQEAYPGWNPQLVGYRLRTLQAKLDALAPKPPAAASVTNAPAATAPTTPSANPLTGTPAVPQPAVTAPAQTAVQPPVEADDRDNQIRALREQVGRLQNEKSVLEAKLQEALSAQPAAIDPRELKKAEERIRALEKDREVLRVSLEVAELKAAKQTQEAAPELKKALADAKQSLEEQANAIAALRQEKEVLQQHLQSARQSEQEAVKSLKQENDQLKQQLASKPAASEPAAATAAANNELTATKAALQSSRETMNSLQARVRTLQEDRDRLENTRKELETRLASAAPAASKAADSAKVKQLEKEREELQKKLQQANRELEDSRKTAKAPAAAVAAAVPATAGASEENSALRARLDVLEARKVPYTPEELALFKKPEEPAALTASPAASAEPKELPANASMLLAEAQRAFGARRFDEAEKKFQAVLQIDDKNVATMQRLAAAQLEQERPQDAEATLKRALAENPKDGRSLLLMGIANFDQKKFDAALDNLSLSAQVDPQNPETQNYLGITLSQKGQRAAAETALRKAIQLSPNYASAHYNLAVVYATQNPPFTELARWHYQKALAYGHRANPEVEKLLEKGKK